VLVCLVAILGRSGCFGTRHAESLPEARSTINKFTSSFKRDTYGTHENSLTFIFDTTRYNAQLVGESVGHDVFDRCSAQDGEEETTHPQ
jgi:hypothetical protein